MVIVQFILSKEVSDGKESWNSTYEKSKEFEIDTNQIEKEFLNFLTSYSCISGNDFDNINISDDGLITFNTLETDDCDEIQTKEEKDYYASKGEEIFNCSYEINVLIDYDEPDFNYMQEIFPSLNC